MRLVFTPHGWDDYTHWLSADRTVLKRVDRLLEELMRDPFTGIGKPEQLKHALAGSWSRVTDEHRLVYLVDGDDMLRDIVILQARYQYS